MIEILALLSLVTGWLLFKLIQSLIDYAIEVSAQGFVGGFIAYSILRSLL